MKYKIISYSLDEVGANLLSSERNGVNEEHLKIEIKASPINDFVEPPKLFDNEVQMKFSEQPSAEHETLLDGIIANHDGKPARTTKKLQEERELVFSVLVNMAHAHPLLKIENPGITGQDQITGYLTSIDNWVNAWKRDGNHAPLIAKISADAVDLTNPYNQFLNQTVDFEGNKTFQFLIGRIPTNPFL